jgi:DNA-binding response OmpR family regulator
MLAGTGFRVETVGNGNEALGMIYRGRFDLVVADIGLPGGLNGLEMAQQARCSKPALKCLFMSGQAAPMVCDPELDDFVPKPFRRSELLGCILKVLQGNQPYPRLDVFHG